MTEHEKTRRNLILAAFKELGSDDEFVKRVRENVGSKMTYVQLEFEQACTDYYKQRIACLEDQVRFSHGRGANDPEPPDRPRWVDFMIRPAFDVAVFQVARDVFLDAAQEHKGEAARLESLADETYTITHEEKDNEKSSG